jgi:hypothetical protein
VENIVINFTSDPSGLQPGIDGLVQLGVVDKANADQAKKTMDTYAARDKTISSGASQSATQVDKLANSFKNLDKNIVGGAYSKSLQDLRTQVSKTGDEYKQLALVIDFAKKRMQDLNPNSPEWAELNKQVAAGEQLLKVYGEQAEVTGGKANTLRTQLQQLKNELSVLEEQGLGNSKQFEDVAVRAAKLEEQIQKTNTRIQAMASETGNIDAFLGSIRGLAAGYEIAAGAEALLGNENKDFEKAIVRLNALMAISNGLREIQEALKAQSIVRIKAEAIGNLVLATSTRLTAGAFAALGISVEATSVAFKVLRAAIITTGIGVLVVAIGLLVEKMMELSEETEKAKGELESFNSSLEFQKAVYDENTREIQRQTKLQIDAAKARGASEKELNEISVAGFAKAKKSSADYTASRIADLKNIDGVHVGSINNAIDAQKALDDVNQKIASIGGSSELDKASDRRAQKTKKLLEEIVAGYQATADAQNEIELSQADYQASLYGRDLKDAKAAADAKVSLTAAGSKEELEARVAALKAGQAIELSNANLTKGERLKILSDSLRQEAELRFSYDQLQKENSIKALEARGSLEKEGSRERLDIELIALEEQKAKELQTTAIVNGKLVQLKELTEQQKAEIEDRYLKLSSDKIKEFAAADAEAEINARISATNARISKLSLSTDATTNAELLENKRKLVDQQAQLEIVGINNTIHNEEERRAKVKEVYAKALADKQALERDKNKAEIDAGLNESKSFNDAQIARANIVLQSEKSTIGERKKALRDYFLFAQANIDAESFSNQTAFDDGVIGFSEFMQKKRAIQTEQDQLDLQREKKHQELINEIVAASFGILQQVSDAYFADQQQKRQDALDQQLSNLNKARDFELANKTLTEDQKAQIDRKYAEKERQLKIAAFNADKDAKKQQAIINGFLAVTNALATVQPFIPAALIAAGVAAVSAGIQVTAISNTRPPAFAKGTREAPAGYKWVGEEGPELTYDRGGYPIITHEESKRLAAKNFYDHSIMQKYDLPIAKAFSALSVPGYSDEMTTAIENHYITNHSGGPEIDYDRLGKAVAKHVGNIENIPQTKLSIDENGFNVSVQKGLDEIAYVNKKLNL